MAAPAAARQVRIGSAAHRTVEIRLNGETFVGDCSGALYWPAGRALIVADLHLEKASAYARRGVMLPPYDTAETLARLAVVVARYRPSLVVALGDSLHDGQGADRLDRSAFDIIHGLQVGRDWLWITGNHDPDVVPVMGGRSAATIGLGAMLLRHEPSAGHADGEISGHLHPAARVSLKSVSIRRPCFVAGAARLVLPAFGAFTGGLNVLDPVFDDVLACAEPKVWLTSTSGIYAVASGDLRPD